MAHDVFISHSSQDKTVADTVCAKLEGRGIRCWIAPRDILAGANWGESIIDAIAGSKSMILILSSTSNVSQQVTREIERAVNKGLVIIPLRIEDISLSKSLEYFLSTAHWLDAFNSSLPTELENLADRVEQLISGAAPPEKKQLPAAIQTTTPSRRWVIGVGTLGLLVVLALVFGVSRNKRVPETTPGSISTGSNLLLGLNSPRMAVEHFRVDPTGVPERLGRLGTGNHQPIRMNDVVRLSLDMDQPQYVLLVAFNPDGSVQLCYPDDETIAPAAIQQLEYPSESDLYFGLTDGQGQQAFLVFVSTEPLPAFASLRKDIEAAGWTANTMGGLWRFDGSKVSQVFADRTDRGTVQRLNTPQFSSLCTSLVEQSSMGRVFGLAFPVE